jgi:hypothetical protein
MISVVKSNRKSRDFIFSKMFSDDHFSFVGDFVLNSKKNENKEVIKKKSFLILK